MTVDEAIRIDTILKDAPVLKDDPKVIGALNLSIEALKFLKRLRIHDDGFTIIRLPGETEK